MMSFSRRSLSSWALFSALLLAVPALAAADDDEDENESMSLLPATPDWVSDLDAAGRFVQVFGSESKFREDYNVQSGAILGGGVYEEWDEGKIIFFDGQIQPVDKQGYGRFSYDELGVFSFDAEVQAWSEFYNSRPGVKDETVLGSRINRSGIFPNTTDSRTLYGGGKPSADWLTLRAGVDAKLPGPFSDAYADVVYREIKGEMSLAKGGTIVDPLAVPPTIPGSGPGTVFFDFPGRKDVDYQTLGGIVGTRSSLGGIAWRFDASAYRHKIESDTREANFGLDFASSELESFREDTEIVTASANLVGSRQVTPELFVYGGGVFSWTESEPDPSQAVQSGFSPAPTTGVITRTTREAEVTRLTEAFSTGLVFQAAPTVALSADVRVRASQQDGDLTEFRNESTLPTGDIGTVQNDSKRDFYSVLAKADVRWKAARRLSFKGNASYRNSQDDIDSSRVFGFAAAEPSEIEKYKIKRERVKVGASGRYRFKGGRRVDIGYDYQYEGSETDVDELRNQFLVADYRRHLHQAHIRFSGRITRKLRGEIRGLYSFEKRRMDAPIVDALIIGTAGKGEVEIQGFTVTPTLNYQHSSTLSGYLNISVGQQQWDLEDAGVKPVGLRSRFASFEYNTITETATIGIHWSPLDRLTGSASYTVYNNNKSVENLGHNARIRSAFELDENWSLTSGIRYLGYSPANNNLDDYDAIIVTMGLSGKF